MFAVSGEGVIMPDKVPFTLFKPMEAPAIGQYAPDRDFGLMGTALLTMAAGQLDADKLSSPAAQEFLRNNKIGVEDIQRTLQKFVAAVNEFREPDSKLGELLRQHGVRDEPRAASLYILSQFGQVCLGFYFDCVRSVMAGKADPTLEDRQQLLARVAEMSQNLFHKPYIQPRYLWLTIIVQAVLLLLQLLL